MSELIAGWAFPGLARKAHYFDAGSITSVCGRWMHSGHREADGGGKSPDDCAACHKARAKRAERGTAQ